MVRATGPGSAPNESAARRRCRGLAQRLGDTLCAVAEPAPEGGCRWRTTHPCAAGHPVRDLAVGSAGTVLALAELVAELGVLEHRRTLAAGAHWLAGAPPLRIADCGLRIGGQPVRTIRNPSTRFAGTRAIRNSGGLPGLYVGEAGVGAALLRAGQALEDDCLVAAALACGERVAGCPHGSPDLFNGTAGRLRFHLWLWEATCVPSQQRAALAAGDSLLGAREDAGEGGWRWRLPPGYEYLSGAASPGYSHGAAGIGDALLDLFEATGDRRFREAVRGAAAWIARLAVPALDDGSGRIWPAMEGGTATTGSWSNSAAAIGGFLLRAQRHGLIPGGADLLAGASRTAARGARWAGATRAHGLPGSIDLLLDLFQATGESAYLVEARSHGCLLEAFVVERMGRWVAASQVAENTPPDYLAGFAGTTTCLLRLSDPERLPRPLTREAFTLPDRGGCRGRVDVWMCGGMDVRTSGRMDGCTGGSSPQDQPSTRCAGTRYRARTPMKGPVGLDLQTQPKPASGGFVPGSHGIDPVADRGSQPASGGFVPGSHGIDPVADCGSQPVATGHVHPSTPPTDENGYLARLREGATAAGWELGPGPDPSGIWIRVRHPGARTPDQGWKLHLSASVRSADALLERALPVLLAEPLAFKVARSIAALRGLNAGEHGLTQVGKFVTVYPDDDRQAVRIAADLDAATRGLAGPVVPSDRPLSPGSRVWYRYGSFGERQLQTPLGEVLPAVETPSGERVPDRRLLEYRAPAWATDPFLAAGIAGGLPPPPGRIGGRYVRVMELYRSASGRVWLCVDPRSGRRCAVKEGWPDAAIGVDGRDAAERLVAEAEILRALSGDCRFPELLEVIQEGDAVYLVLSDLDGETLEQHLRQITQAGRSVPGAQVVAWGRELAGMIRTLHERGLVYRDLKSTNVIRSLDGLLRLVDFDATQPVGSHSLPDTRGTRGYASPQQRAGAPADPRDDVYGLGALLFLMATGAEPSFAPDPFDLTARPVRLLNPAIGAALDAVIVRCLAVEPERRFGSMEELDAALADLGDRAAVVPPPFGAAPQMAAARMSPTGSLPAEPVPGEAAARAHSRMQARRLGDTLCARALPTRDGDGVYWTSSHPTVPGGPLRDLSVGCAGTVLALAELVAELGVPAHAATLSRGARALAASQAPGALLPGLYVGEAGVGAAMLRAGQVLDDAGLVAAAAERGRAVAALPHRCPDLYNGTAGRLRFHLWLWEAVRTESHLRDAVAAGEFLLAAAADAEEGGLRWPIPPGYSDLSGPGLPGYSHGAAGIGDALLDLFEATGDARFREAARAAATWIARLAIPEPDDGRGLDWPHTEDGPPAYPFWCHGAAGIGRFLLHAARHDLLPHAWSLALGAGRSVAAGPRWANPTQCHGLAGNGEFLLDLYQATGDPVHLAAARSLAGLLDAFGREQEGLLVYSCEWPEVFTPDYLVGYAGVATCLLRLSGPERLPHQLSCDGFRRPPPTASRGWTP